MNKQEEEPVKQHDFVEHGSEAQATFLGLVKAADPKDKFQIDGWTLSDMTVYGPAATPDFLMRTLQQKVNELKTKPIVHAGAPKMWIPSDSPPSGIV